MGVEESNPVSLLVQQALLPETTQIPTSSATLQPFIWFWKVRVLFFLNGYFTPIKNYPTVPFLRPWQAPLHFSPSSTPGADL